MKLMHRIGVVLWLALALAIGQQAGLSHGLAHAAQGMTQEDGAPASSACEHCAACAQLTGMTSVGMPPIAAASGRAVALPAYERSLPTAAPVYFLSRAPPALS